MKIYIIRHGETRANKDGLLQGQSNFDINEYGVELAGITGRGMRDIRFDAVYSSPLSRALHTAEIVLQESGNGDGTGADGPEILLDDRIKEISMGDWELKKFRPGESEVPLELSMQFLKNPLGMGRMPGGESVEDVMVRTEEFLREMAAECAAAGCENVLVSTHGCAIRAMLHFLYDDQSDYWQGNVPFNCCVNILETDGTEFSFVEKDKVYYSEEQIVDRYEIQ